MVTSAQASRARQSGDVVTQIQTLTAREVLALGELSEMIVQQWTRQWVGNRVIVLTGRQRLHYLTRHPEVAALEQYLRDAVLSPDEVQRNKTDRTMAIFYKRVDAEHYVRVAVRMQPTPGTLKHSILSYRIAREKEVRAGLARRAWSKK